MSLKVKLTPKPAAKVTPNPDAPFWGCYRWDGKTGVAFNKKNPKQLQNKVPPDTPLTFPHWEFPAVSNGVAVGRAYPRNPTHWGDINLRTPSHISCCGIGDVGAFFEKERVSGAEGMVERALFGILAGYFWQIADGWSCFLTKKLKLPFLIFSHAAYQRKKKAGKWKVGDYSYDIEELAAFLKEKELGEFVQFTPRKNPNSGHDISMLVWTPDYDAVEKWIKGVDERLRLEYEVSFAKALEKKKIVTPDLPTASTGGGGGTMADGLDDNF